MSRPDARCGYDNDGLWLCETDSRADSRTAPGLCRNCDMGSCALCGGPLTPEQCAESRRRAPVEHRNEVYCPETCLEEDSDGVPEPIDAEQSCAQTVRLPREPIGAEGLGEVLAERGREIAAERGELSAAVA